MSDATVNPIATAQMMIRRPPAAIFSAFTLSSQLTRFWLSMASDDLAPGAEVRWEFMVPGASVGVEVEEFEPSSRLRIRWSDGTTVQWTFAAEGDGTIVTVVNEGFTGSAEERIKTAIESTQGFTIVLCDLKTLLERGESMDLVRDKARLIEASFKDRSQRAD